MHRTHRLEQQLLRLPRAHRGIHVHWPHRAGTRRRGVLFERAQRGGRRDVAVLVGLLLLVCALYLAVGWMSDQVADAMTIAAACDGKCVPTVVHIVR